MGPVFLSPGDHMVSGRNEGGSSRHRQSIKGGPKKINFQLAVNEQGVCVRVCVRVRVCVCVCGKGGAKEGVLQSLMGRSGKFHCDITKIIQAINYGLSLVF